MMRKFECRRQSCRIYKEKSNISHNQKEILRKNKNIEVSSKERKLKITIYV
jgi:hypothetical protein